MQYYFNNLSATAFQRLVNTILVERFGEDIRLTPLYGSDGGRDGETAPGNPNFEIQIENGASGIASQPSPSRPGRYLFQVKHHRTVDVHASDARRYVLSDFEDELKRNVLNRSGSERVNYFFLITNVPSSRDALSKLDKKRSELLKGKTDIHADIWWQDQVNAYLDQMPSVWASFPEMFAGNKVPIIAQSALKESNGLPRAVRMAIDNQYRRDENVKFRQIDLEKSLFRLFIDLDVTVRYLAAEEQQQLLITDIHRRSSNTPRSENEEAVFRYSNYNPEQTVSALGTLLDESCKATRKLILEGGPGQGKSTVTQMAAQIYRQTILNSDHIAPEDRWSEPQKSRLPFRLELRDYGEQLNQNDGISIEEYLASLIKQNSGGSTVTVDQIHDIIESSPVIFFFDGLDEVGSDELRDRVLEKISECIERFENTLKADIRVVITTRPPAIAGRREKLADFRRLLIVPLEPLKVKNYVDRWLAVQIQDEYDKQQIRKSFESRQREPHVQALVKNPMQLSVLLHFIRLKGEAFPDRRAELYRDYFRIVIDRDVEKSPELRRQRDLIETLHQFLGYKIHALTEAKQADGSLTRKQLLQMVEAWLRRQGNETKTASDLFKLGEERLGLIVALKGEGEDAAYGYEIQPVREYFAAAFINDQIRGDAHAIYQVMIRRPYWREVALFLAGLRRPNEKADLVVRAKNLDNDKELGWRQDGRTVTLQLLQEGVFSQPQHVFSEALDFVMDLIDPRVVASQNEPEGLVNILPILIKQEESNRQSERLLRLLRDFQTSEDEHLVFRLHRVASQVFDKDVARQYLLSHQGKSLDLIVKTRLTWPCTWGISMTEAVQVPSFWEGAPEDIWAGAWLQAGYWNDAATFLPVPAIYHQGLAIQFAATPDSILGNNDRRRLTSHSISNWAIWMLANYVKTLRNTQNSLPITSEIRDYISVAIAEHSNANFSGLEDSTQVVVKDLLEATKIVLSIITSEEKTQFNAFATFIPILLEYLQRPGLESWLVCRQVREILRTIFAIRSNYVRTSFQGIELIDQFDWGEDSQLYRNLWRELRLFYADPANQKQSSATSTIQQTTDLNMMLIAPHRFSRMDFCPTHIRLQYGGKLVAIADLIAQHICTGSDLPFDWLTQVPYTSDIVRPIVDRCNKESFLPMLRIFSTLKLSWLGVEIPLLTHDLQRILKIARTTDDTSVVAGALVAVSTSKFLRIAGASLTQKMIRASRGNTDFGIGLFLKARYANPTLNIEDLQILTEIAQGMLKSPSDYETGMLNYASEFLSEYTPLNLPPLLLDEEKYGLDIHFSKENQ